MVGAMSSQMKAICMIYQRDLSSVALFVDKKRLAAFQNALHVAVWVGREQTGMVSAVLPQS